MTKKLIVFAIFTLAVTIIVFPFTARGAALTNLSNTMTRMKTSELSSHDILFDLGGSTTLDASETVVIDFHEDESDFTVAGASTVVGDLGFNDGTERVIVDVDGDCTGHSGVNDIVASINDTTGILTFTTCGTFNSSGAGATINVEYGTAAGGTNRVTNPGSADTYVLDITAAADTGKIAAAILTDDQFTVSADVDPTLSFSISASSTDFGTLSDSSVTTSTPNITFTISTNAENGYTVSVQDAGDTANPGLYNSSATFLIGSGDYSYNNSADLGSVAGYGIQCASGDATCQAPYNVSGDNVGGYELTAQTFANHNSTANSHSVTLTSKAKITGATAAGAYTDTVTVICTGLF